ncbi:MAG TPA: hypothetical protein VH120_04910, partial [Gemmataceae bacterium]|nr:hypothetical protein [Gemmataceae bacterium]
MTHDDALLERLNEWRPEGDGPHSFGHTRDDGWTVNATAESVDSVGGRLSELAVGRPAPEKPATAADLKHWGGNIAGRVTG